MKREYTEEEKEKNRERARKWGQEHKEKVLEKVKKWNQEHKEERKEYLKEYRKKHKEDIKNYLKTPFGRASYLLQNYRREDRKYQRGEIDFDAKWIVENILSKPCVHCGETDWTKIGCNRLDNFKPHTMDNVEPCCAKCNRKLYKKKG